MQTEEIKPCSQQIESECVASTASIHSCVSIKTVPNHFAPIKSVRIYEFIIMFQAILSRVVCDKMLRILLFIYRGASWRQSSVVTPAILVLFMITFRHDQRLTLSICHFASSSKNKWASLWSAQQSTERSTDMKGTERGESSRNGMFLSLAEVGHNLWGVPSISCGIVPCKNSGCLRCNIQNCTYCSHLIQCNLNFATQGCVKIIRK